jgi:hypothetical protein
VTIDGIEVTQAIQNLAHGVPPHCGQSDPGARLSNCETQLSDTVEPALGFSDG